VGDASYVLPAGGTWAFCDTGSIAIVSTERTAA
jgi:hypothetical protein